MSKVLPSSEALRRVTEGSARVVIMGGREQVVRGIAREADAAGYAVADLVMMGMTEERAREWRAEWFEKLLESMEEGWLAPPGWPDCPGVKGTMERALV